MAKPPSDTSPSPRSTAPQLSSPYSVGEVVGGELVINPRPPPKHVHAASRLGALLTTPFDLGQGGPGGWHIVHQPELALGVDPDYEPIVPELAGWTKSSIPSMPDSGRFHAVPAWVCEILVPGTGRRDRTQKLPFYGRAGVATVWLVDPIEETIEVFVNDGKGAWYLGSAVVGNHGVRLAPFEAAEITLAVLWGA